MDNDFFKYIQENCNWYVSMTVALIASVASILSKHLSGPLGKLIKNIILQRSLTASHKVNLAKHPLFAKYQFLKNQRIKYIRCKCPLRKKIFTDLMLIRIDVYDRNLKSFIKRKDLDSLTPIEFKYAINELLLKIFSEWETLASQQDIPRVVIHKTVLAIEDVRYIVSELTDSISNSCYSYDSNQHRTSAIFDVFNGVEEAIITKLEESLDQMNGEISGIKYKDIECLHCEHCQSKHSIEI